VDGEASAEYDAIAEGSPIFSADSRHVAYRAWKGARRLVVVDGQEAGAEYYDGIVKNGPTFHSEAFWNIWDQGQLALPCQYIPVHKRPARRVSKGIICLPHRVRRRFSGRAVTPDGTVTVIRNKRETFGQSRCGVRDLRTTVASARFFAASTFNFITICSVDSSRHLPPKGFCCNF